MKLLTYRQNGTDRVGVLSGDGSAIHTIEAYASMQELIESGRGSAEILELAKAGKTVPYAGVERRSPIPHPKQDIICLGINYMDHARESAAFAKKDFSGHRPHAVYFSKRAAEATPDGGLIPPHWDIVENMLDYEVELAVIIGRDASRVSREDAYGYVFGYSILNDVSARNIQRRHQQFYFGKSLDGFTAFGPWIVTADEFALPLRLGLRSYVNGELRQNSNTEYLIFDVAHIISELSAGMLLKAGTVIATGTPSGVGMGFDPPRYLQKGDEVRCEIDGIGALTNTVG